MRGAPLTAVLVLSVHRIIPAYAGSTRGINLRRAREWDHPRVCGEHGIDERFMELRLGSSPRMRGARYRASAFGSKHGIIPAYAGSTALSILSSCSPQDHPRVCGEHIICPELATNVKGSSPRMRGARG